MELVNGIFFEGGQNIFCCRSCRTRLALDTHIIATTFRCSNGEAYLFKQVINSVNVAWGEPRLQNMVTGTYIVEDIFCVGCSLLLGWKYVYAIRRSQKIKERLFVIDRSMISEPDADGSEESEEADTNSQE